RDGVTLVLDANPARGTLSGTKTVDAVGGVATFSGLSVDKAGTGYTLVALSGALASATSAGFDIGPSAPAKLGFTAQPSTATAGVAISPAVQIAVQDQFGNTVSSATVLLTVAIGDNPGGGALSGTPTVSAVNGVATFNNLSISKAASRYTLSAVAAGLAGATSAAFDIRLVFARVSAGRSHACGVTSAGAAYCWGGNGYGQLGNGTTNVYGEGSPVLVLGGLSFATLSAGDVHTCGLTTGGAAYCWGDNSAGQLGTGTTMSSSSPVLVSGGLTFATVSTGNLHTCGVTSAGAGRQAYCWGSNIDGQLGDGTTTQRTSPVVVVGVLSFAAVNGVSFHTCSVTSAGAAYCWGDNSYGQLGDGTTT